MKIFETKAALVAATLTAGQIVETKGYTTAGDPGAGRYLIQTAAEFGGTPDGFIDHTLANGNVAVLQQNGIVWAEQIGMTSADSSANLQAAWDLGLLVMGSKGAVYGFASEVVYKRGGGFIGFGSDTQPLVDLSSPTIPSRATILRWVGTATSNSIIRASKTAVGTAHSSAFEDSMYGFTFKHVVIDGADLADYGLYANRAHGADVLDVVATRTNKHGFYVNGFFSGYWRKLLAFKNNGCGISVGRAFLDFGAPWALAQVNAGCMQDLWGFSNGFDGTFDETTNPLWGYGVGLWLNRGNFVTGVRAENNDGANFVFSPSSFSNSVNQIYSELANSLDIGGGATAISQGRATQKWGFWYSPSDAGAYGNAIRFGVASGEYVRITGTEPSTGRVGQPFELEQIGGASGVSADWGGYVLKNCDANLHNTVVGSAARSASGTENGFIKLPELMPQGMISFNATTASFVESDSVNASGSYAGVGLYDITVTDAMDDVEYTVVCPPSAANRIVYVSKTSTSAFRIGHTNASGTATDASAVLTAYIFGRRKS